MTSTDEATAHAGTAGIHALLSRGAGYAVALKCIEVQARAEALDPSLHSGNRVTLHADAWPWYTGAIGEIEVGRLLTALGTEWFVRHAVPIGAEMKDVDHLVIGPGGVFAINTKHHRDASVWVGDYVLRVNKANTPHISIAQGDGLDVARRLSNKTGFAVPVVSVIAVLHARSLVDGRAPENRRVAVVDAQHLTRWILAQPRSFDDTELALIKLAAEEPQTWHTDPHAADTLRVLQRFERLVAQVGNPRPPATARTGAPATGAMAPAAPHALDSRLPRTKSRNRPATANAVGSQARKPRTRKSTSADLVRLGFAAAVLIAGFAWLYEVVR
jgi:hypothetical protein